MSYRIHTGAYVNLVLLTYFMGPSQETGKLRFYSGMKPMVSFESGLPVDRV